MTDWKAVPKIELHLHLEGAAPPDFIRQLAGEKRMDLSDAFAEDGGYRWSDFAHFLKTYELACTVLQSPDDYRRLVEAVLAKSAAGGVIYTEIFIAPDLCGDGSDAAWREYLAAMLEGARAGQDEHGIDLRFVSTAVRHFGAERAENAARLSAEAAGAMVTGFGMGGEERHGHPRDFARAFAIAGEAGLGLTAHAGEISGAESVRAALDHLGVSRLGHGVRAIEDADLVRRLADEAVVLEVNPGSNVALGVFPSWVEHPIARLREAGVKVTISTDDPPYFHTDMAHEYAMLAETFGWSEAEFREMNRIAAEAAFCDAATRAGLLARLENGAA